MTPDVAGYRAVDTRACLITDWTTMQSNLPQGDLMAWQPLEENANLAYVGPSTRSSWFIGDLILAKSPDFTERISLAPGVYATGDLTWSPSGDTLAFLAFRPNENLYTVMTVRADGSSLVDHFPTDLARTDARTSQKAIIGWKDEKTLQVISSCGEECRNAYDINVAGAPEPALTPTPLSDYTELRQNLQLTRRVQEYAAENFPRIFNTPDTSKPHWSPKDRWVAYLDKKLLLWVLSPEEKITFLVDIGLRDVSETQWAPDESRLAIRAEDRIFVFQIPCQPQE